jgi:hypothetical protein
VSSTTGVAVVTTRPSSRLPRYTAQSEDTEGNSGGSWMTDVGGAAAASAGE